MKKKKTNLHIRKETIAQLTYTNKKEVAGGKTGFSPCSDYVHCMTLTEQPYFISIYEFKITDWENHFRFDFRQTWRP